MSAQGQFVCFLIALILVGIAAIIRLSNRAWDAAFVAAALGFGFFVLVWNAAEAM